MENRICLFPDLLVLLAAGLILLGSVGPWATIEGVSSSTAHMASVPGGNTVITGFSDYGGRPALFFIGIAGFMVIQLMLVIGAFPRASLVTATCSLLIAGSGVMAMAISLWFMRTFSDISHLSLPSGHAFPVHVGYGLRLVVTGGLLALLGGPIELAMRRKPAPVVEEVPAA